MCSYKFIYKFVDYEHERTLCIEVIIYEDHKLVGSNSSNDFNKIKEYIHKMLTEKYGEIIKGYKVMCECKKTFEKKINLKDSWDSKDLQVVKKLAINKCTKVRGYDQKTMDWKKFYEFKKAHHIWNYLYSNNKLILLDDDQNEEPFGKLNISKYIQGSNKITGGNYSNDDATKWFRSYNNDNKMSGGNYSNDDATKWFRAYKDMKKKYLATKKEQY